MGEFAPIWQKAKMSKWQVKRYIKEMEEKRENAKKRLEEAKKRWELNNKAEIEEIEKELDKL
jgi:hypothetical protein